MAQMHRKVEPTAYRTWVTGEGVDVIPGHYIRDLRAVELKPWARMGGTGCYINHDDSDNSNDCYVVEIAPGEELNPQRHLHEVMIYVLSGRGTTAVWREGEEPQSFEWEEGSLFAIPLNSSYQHYNGSGSAPARLLAVTNAPAVINMFADPAFVFSCDYDFSRRFDGQQDYFSGAGTLEGRVWESNFIPDVRVFELIEYAERGAGGVYCQFKLAKNTMVAHVSEFPVGTYKKAHRHGPGAHLIILNGTGYSLMWNEGEEPIRYDWVPGSLVIPPDRTFHQHFNTGAEPARYLALRYTHAKRAEGGTGLPMSSISTRLGGDQIDYEDEDEAIRKVFRTESEANGAVYRMGPYFGEEA